MTIRIGLFYGSSTCYTEMAGEKIRDHINSRLDANMEGYNYLILGIPTWDYGELQEDWETHWEDIDSLDLAHAKAAVYGLGDQIGYPQWFQDALGYLWTKMVNQGATTVGAWPNKGYTFEQSKALTNDEKFFVGLPLDDENQLELSDEFISLWCDQLLTEFGLTST
jgi:flavodoxin II